MKLLRTMIFIYGNLHYEYLTICHLCKFSVISIHKIFIDKINAGNDRFNIHDLF